MMLFCLYFAILIITKAESGEIKGFRKIIESRQGQDELSPDVDQCIWSNDIHNAAPDAIIDYDNTERLVIYYYRHKLTDDIYMFLPNKNLQYCFPNLTPDNEDELKIVNSDDLKQILDSNPISLKMDEETVTSLDNDPMAIGLNQGVIETDNITHSNPTTYDRDKLNPEAIVTHMITSSNENGEDDEAKLITKDTTLPVYNEELVFESNTLVDNPDKIIGIPDSKDLKELINTAEIPANYFDDTNDEAKDSIFVPLRALLGNQMTFDEWFTQQMLRFVEMTKIFHESIDVKKIKSDVEKTFHDNLIFIRNDGVLVDSNGKLINPTNLRLRPILIGESVAYKKVLTLKDDTTPFTSNLPFLDTIVVTQVFPPRLLSIIPLGKTFVPNTSSRRLIGNINQHKSTGNTPRKAAIPSIGDKPYSHQGSPEKRDAIKDPASKVKKTVKNPNRQRKFHSPRDFLGLFDIYNSLLGIAPDKQQKPSTLNALNTPKEELDSDNAEDVDIDDNLGLRIIGGNPATSSGTPLSNRGRSSKFFDFFK